MDHSDWWDSDAYGYIYITWINNPKSSLHEKLYIGQRLVRRDSKLKPGNVYYGSGRKITNYIKKYGKKGLNKILLDTAESQEELNELEAFHVSQILDNPQYLNLINGGMQKGISEELRQKISNSRKQNIYSEERKNQLRYNAIRMGHLNKGIKKSEETKEKNRLAHIGKPVWNKGLTKYTDIRVLSYSQTNKLSQTGKVRSIESINKALETRKRNNSKTGPIGKNWYTNGQLNCLAITCPEGYYKGRVINNKRGKK